MQLKYFLLLAFIASTTYGATLRPIITPRIYGVNLGGWLVIEQFLNPSMFEAANNPEVRDEYTWGQYLHEDEAMMELQRNHWDTWFTEADVQEMAEVGITHVRIPIGYWPFLTREEMDAEGEYFQLGQLPYLVRLLRWLQTYNIKALMDLHCAPGSQNGWDNSGRMTDTPMWGTGNTLNRTYVVLERMAEWIKELEDDPTTADVVVGLEVLNEPFSYALQGGMELVQTFYLEAYPIVRQHLPADRYWYVIDHAFQNELFPGFMPEPEYENVILDIHIYHCFDEGLRQASYTAHLTISCEEDILNLERQTLPTFIGEWSVAYKVDSVYAHLEPYPTPCEQGFMARFARTQMQVYESFFYWTWKTEHAPMWDNQLGVRDGWLPTYPLDDEDSCFDTVYECDEPSVTTESTEETTSISLSISTSDAPTSDENETVSPSRDRDRTIESSDPTSTQTVDIDTANTETIDRGSGGSTLFVGVGTIIAMILLSM